MQIIDFQLFAFFILQENHEKSRKANLIFVLFEQCKPKYKASVKLFKIKKMENIHILKERLSMQFTSRDLLDLLEDSILMKNENPKDIKQIEKKYVYGISGIQKLLNCSESSAKRLKKSGVIDDAIIQNGRKIIIDVDRAMELLKSNKPGRKSV